MWYAMCMRCTLFTVDLSQWIVICKTHPQPSGRQSYSIDVYILCMHCIYMYKCIDCCTTHYDELCSCVDGARKWNELSEAPRSTGAVLYGTSGGVCCISRNIPYTSSFNGSRHRSPILLTEPFCLSTQVVRSTVDRQVREKVKENNICIYYIYMYILYIYIYIYYIGIKVVHCLPISWQCTTFSLRVFSVPFFQWFVLPRSRK